MPPGELGVVGRNLNTLVHVIRRDVPHGRDRAEGQGAHPTTLSRPNGPSLFRRPTRPAAQAVARLWSSGPIGTRAKRCGVVRIFELSHYSSRVAQANSSELERMYSALAAGHRTPAKRIRARCGGEGEILHVAAAGLRNPVRSAIGRLHGSTYRPNRRCHGAVPGSG